jgi:hypothetical protein
MQPGWRSPRLPHGDVVQFANGFIVARPMELPFVVGWTVPAVQPTDSGLLAPILSRPPLELS